VTLTAPLRPSSEGEVETSSTVGARGADRARARVAKVGAARRDPKPLPPGGGWMTVEQAAAFLSLPVVTLRRSLERHARTTPEGATVAHVDGITARKLGRLWRVWLDRGWLAPPQT
jgi:hypothetical protein